jgi:hypothetical protein
MTGRFACWCKEFALGWWDVMRYAFPTIIAVLVCVHYTDYRGVIHITSIANWFGFLSTLAVSVISRIYRTPGWWFIVAFLNYAVVAAWQASASHHHGNAGQAVKESWFASHWCQIKKWTLFWLPTILTVLLMAAAWGMGYLPVSLKMVLIGWTVAVPNAAFIWWWTVRHSGH